MNKILLGFIGIGLLTFFGCKNDKVNTSTSSTNTNSSSLIETTKIGEQEWMRENLNLDHFQNGDIIQEVKTDSEWQKAGKNKEPAWCYYGNNSLNGEKYGKLYNFYAVTDPRGLAPNGWHVPTDAEWTLLTDYLTNNGHSGAEGRALKSKFGWNDYKGNSGNGTDTYGWLGLPGGSRGLDGYFDYIGYDGYWWSSSQSSTSDAWNRYVYYNYDYVSSYLYNKQDGFSVRCLRD